MQTASNTLEGRDLAWLPVDPRTEPFLSAPRLAELLGVSLQTVSRQIRNGEVAGHVSGRRGSPHRINTLVWLRSQGYDL